MTIGKIKHGTQIQISDYTTVMQDLLPVPPMFKKNIKHLDKIGQENRKCKVLDEALRIIPEPFLAWEKYTTCNWWTGLGTVLIIANFMT